MLWIPTYDVCSPARAHCTAVDVQCASAFLHRVANCVQLDADFSECDAVHVECAPSCTECAASCTESVACCATCVAIHVVSSLHFYRTRSGRWWSVPPFVRGVSPFVWNAPRTTW